VTRDVVKLADFGLARETRGGGGAFTEYVSTRWYRAPEVRFQPRLLEVRSFMSSSLVTTSTAAPSPSKCSRTGATTPEVRLMLRSGQSSSHVWGIYHQCLLSSAAPSTFTR